MSRAIGMIEFRTVSSGVTAADNMVKTSEVELLEAQTVCPGKYIALIAGILALFARRWIPQWRNIRMSL